MSKTRAPKRAASTARAKAVRPRDPVATRKRILEAARREFARLGLSGARVDAIAARAQTNKRMLYHYFGGKHALFLAVLESAYGDIRAAERKLDLEHLDPVAAIKSLVTFTWQYYLKHPEFLTLVNSENLHKAKHLKQSKIIGGMHEYLVAMVSDILARGVREGMFREGVDPIQLNITIAAIGYYYLTNRFTGAIIYKRDLMTPGALDRRLKFNLETVLRLVLSPAHLQGAA
jgi:AcrR family transcriptional regulator